jgi:hypothetical protein
MLLGIHVYKGVVQVQANPVILRTQAALQGILLKEMTGMLMAMPVAAFVHLKFPPLYPSRDTVVCGVGVGDARCKTLESGHCSKMA